MNKIAVLPLAVPRMLLRPRSAAGDTARQDPEASERAFCGGTGPESPRSRPSEITKKASDAFCARVPVPQNASDAFRWGGVSEATVQSQAAAANDSHSPS